MVSSCCVPGCRSEWSPDTVLSFHSFPKDPTSYKLWTAAVGREKVPAGGHVCSTHFQPEDFETHTRVRRLKRTAVPVYLLPTSTKPPPRTELTVPTLCISSGSERYLEIPTLTSELQPLPSNTVTMPMPVITKTVSLKQSSNTLFLEDESLDLADNGSEKSEEGERVEQEEQQEDQDEEEEEQQPEEEEDDDINIQSDLPSETVFVETNTPAPTLSSTPAPASTVPAYKQTQLIASQRKRIDLLTRKVKILQNRLKRRNIKQEKMVRILEAVKNYTKYSEIENILSGNYRKLCEALNNNGVCVNYSDEVIKFAITVNYYSPKAYEFIRKYIPLPTARMLHNYTSRGTYIINLDD